MRRTRKTFAILTLAAWCAGVGAPVLGQARPEPRRAAALTRTDGRLLPQDRVAALTATQRRAYTEFFALPLPPAVEVQLWNGRGTPGGEFFGFSQISLQQDWALEDVKWWYRFTCRDARAVRAVWQAARFDFPKSAEGWQNPPGLIARGQVQPLPAPGQWALFQVDYTPFAPSPDGPRVAEAPSRSTGPASRTPPGASPPRAAPTSPSRGAAPAQASRQAAGARGTAPALTAAGANPALALVAPDRVALARAMRALPMPATFFVRVLVFDAQGAVLGSPSPSIALTFGPPAQGTVTFTREGFGHPTATFESYQSPRPDAADSLCIYRSIRDFQDPLTRQVVWPKGTYFDMCQPKDSSFLDDVGDVVGGFFGALGDLVNWVSTAYESAKGALIGAVVTALKSTVGCGGTCQALVAGALEAGLYAVGLPPTLPNFDQMVDMGADYLAAKIAAEAGVPEGAAQEAMGAFVDEVRKSRERAPSDVWLVPDPDCQYRPGHVLLTVTNRSTGFSQAVVLHLRPKEGAFYKESELPVPPMAPGATMRIPVFLQPAEDPSGWRGLLPTAQDGPNPGVYFQKHQQALAARALWEAKYAAATTTFEAYTANPANGTNFPQFTVVVQGNGSASVQ